MSGRLWDVPGMAPGGEGSWLAQGERRHNLVIYNEPAEEPGQVGAGTVHHVAFAIRDGDEQRWRDRLARRAASADAGDGSQDEQVRLLPELRCVLFEPATEQPGFVFEPADSLGGSLMLAGDPGNRGAEPGQRFPPLANPRAGTTGRAAAC
jgi:glyoxalase family protein